MFPLHLWFIMKSKKRRIFEITGYVVVGLFFTLAVVGLIIKFNKGTLYIFNNRADVVLSNSMSVKSEKYKDFLEGHDNQIQKNDLVISSTIDSEENLNIYDIVLFNSPLLGTTMHRIVGKELYNKDSFSLDLVNTCNYKGENVIQLPEVGSQITSDDTISFNEVKLVVYSPNQYSDGYSFVAQNNLMSTEVKTEEKEGFYKHTIIARRDSSAPTKFLLVHKNYFSYEEDYIVNFSMNAARGEININANSITSTGETGSYYYETNWTYKYVIRGDANEDDDGKFTIDSIYSKVHTTIPKVGAIIRYLSSIWGIVLLIGLSVIIVGTDFYLDRMKKKEQTKSDIAEETETKDDN